MADIFNFTELLFYQGTINRTLAGTRIKEIINTSYPYKYMGITGSIGV